MGTVKNAIVDLAANQGYEGDAPQTIAEAVDALGTVAGGGSGGGGDGASVLVVKFDTEGMQTATADKTPEEIHAAFNSGKTVIGTLHNTGGVEFGPFLISPYTNGGEYDYVSTMTFEISTTFDPPILYAYALAHFGDGGINIVTQRYQLTKAN